MLSALRGNPIALAVRGAAPLATEREILPALITTSRRSNLTAQIGFTSSGSNRSPIAAGQPVTAIPSGTGIKRGQLLSFRH